eukprot:scaffold5.g841.t1
MEPSLEDLLSGLQAVQKQQSSVRLSERNVVELVSKLRQLGLLGDELLHTTNGREFITRERLQEEVRAAVDQAGGRVALVDLPSLLGVDLAHCERAAEAVVASANGDLLAAQGELFSQAYFDGLAAEVDELLQEAGVVSLGDLARRFALSTELVMSALGVRVGGVISGRLEGGLIYTPAHLARVRAQVAKYGVPSAQQFLAQAFPDGVALGSAYLAPAVVEQVAAAAEEALAAGSWCDVQTCLPGALPSADVVAVLSKVKAVAAATASGGAKVLAGTCVVATPFLDSLRQQLLELARQAAEEAHRQQKQRQHKGGGGAAGGGAPGEAAPGGKAAVPGGKKAAAAAAESDDDDDWDTGRGKGKKGKGRKGKGGGGGGGGTAKAAGGAKGKAGGGGGGGGQQAQQGGDAAAAGALSAGRLAVRVLELQPELEAAGADGELPAAIVAELRPAALQEYERTLHAIFTAGAERRRRLREAAAAALDEAAPRLAAYAHGAELFGGDEATLAVLHRHLLRTVAAEVADALLRYLTADEAAASEAEGGDEAAGGGPAAGPLTPAQRAAVLKRLQPDVKAPVTTAVDKLGGSCLEEFTTELQAAADAAGLRLRRLDKKGERAWAEQAGDPGTLLALAVPALLARHTGRAVSLPGRALAAGVEQLAGQLPEEAHQLLADFHAGVVEHLRAQAEGGGGGGELAAKLEGMAPCVRALGGSGKEHSSKGTMTGPDWEQLLLRSEDLVRSDQDFPRVERDILQAGQRGRGGAPSQPATRLAQGRFVACLSALIARPPLGAPCATQEGLNPRKLTQALQTFELRPSYEDVFRGETSSVHEMISVSAIQETQASAVAAFEDFMDSCMDAEWQQEKRALFDAVMPYSAATGTGASPGPGLSPGPLSPYAPARVGAPAGGAAPSPAYRGLLARGGAGAGRSPLAGGGLVLRGRAAKYAEVVRKINQAAASHTPYPKAVSDFAAACADEPTGERRTTMLRVWRVLERLLAGLASLPAAAHTQRVEALLAGARRYLEENFQAYMSNVAALGGSPSRLGLVNAFLRVKEKDRGPLDFDQPGGLDTTWRRVYTCLRAGFLAEAAQVGLVWGGGEVARGSRDVPSTPRASGGGAASDFAGMLQEWADGGCRPLSGEHAAALAAEADRLLRDKSAGRARQPFHAHRVACHALLAGANRAAEGVAREAPAFFPTIEDFLWFKLGLVSTTGGGSTTTSFGAGGGTYLEPYSLADLQSYLRQYPPAHYSHGGKEPLLYVVVLLLSLQFKAAVSFLAKEAATRDYRLDAVHLGICLHHYGLLGGAGGGGASPPPAGGGGSVEVGTLAHRYGREFVFSDPGLALEYYMAAAAALGDSLAVKGQLLRELLVESKAYGFLLGGGGPGGGEGGALAVFVPDAAERGRVLEAVAHECAGERGGAAAQLEEAVELFMFAGRPRQALRILNQRLSDLVEPAAADPAHAEEVETVISRGNAAIEAFDLLKCIRDMLAAAVRGDHARTLQKLSELPCVPTEAFRLQLCATGVAALHPAVADRLPAVLLAAAGALAAARKREQLQTVVAFAAAVPNRISQAVYQQLNQLQASVA